MGNNAKKRLILALAAGWLSLVGSTSLPALFAQSAAWLSGPPASSGVVPVCPESRQWLFLYWAGTSASIEQAARLCPSADRFWSMETSRWLGFSPSQPQASDTWMMLPGMVAFVHGKAGAERGVALNVAPTVHGFATFYEPAEHFAGVVTPCGTVNSTDAAVAAVRPGRYPCGVQLRVTEPRSGRSIEVVVKDHCPGCEWNQLDLSLATFARLANPALGRLDVVWTVIDR